MSDTPKMDEKSSDRPVASVRWWPLWAILATGVVVIGCFLGLPDLYRGLRVVGTMATCGAVLLLFTIWLLAFSRLRRKTKYMTLAAVWLPIVIFFSLRRIDTSDGDMDIRTTWRWEPLPLEKLESYLEESGADKNSAADDGNLATQAAADYPAFLGQGRAAVVAGTQLATDWEAQPPKELWRHPVGLGWSAFAISGDYAVTQEQRRVAEPYAEGVVASEARTGKQLWVHTDSELLGQPEALGGNGPRATPTIVGQHVYALGATGVLNCLKLTTGKRVWSTNILEDASAKNVQWGMAGSPLYLPGLDLIVVCPGGENGQCVAAYNMDSGERVWHSGSEEETAGYASPVLTSIGGQEQIVMLTGKGLSGYVPKTGEMLWHYPWKFARGQEIVCSQPLIVDEFDSGKSNRVLLSCGYGVGSEMVKITQAADGLVPESVWTTSQLRSKFSNMVLHKGHIFGLSEGILTCLDLETGKKKWKSRDGYYGHGQLILAGDVLLIQTEKRKGRFGDVVLVEANRDRFKELAVLPALSDKTWNPPALAGNLLIIRNDREAACYELPVVTED
jgi:outer membrane protein assembly factor BamB